MAKSLLTALDTPASLMSSRVRNNSPTTNAGQGAKAHSRAGSATSNTSPTDFDKVLSDTTSEDETTEDYVLWHETLLMQELSKPDWHDMELIENILKALVVAEYVVYPMSRDFMPEQAAKVLAKRYPKLKIEKLQVSSQASAMAQKTSETARSLAKRVKDPACLQLLESVANFLDMYVRPEPNKISAVGAWKTSSKHSPRKRETNVPAESEPPAPRPASRTHVGAFHTTVPKFFANITNNTVNTPRTATTTTTSTVAITTTMAAVSSAIASPRQTTPPTARAMRQLAATELKNPDEVQKRAKLRDVLFAALATYSPQAITQALDDLPEDVTLASYLPVANPERFRIELSKSARQYAKIFNQDDGLLNYINWYEIYHDLMLRNDLTLALDPALMSAIKPEVVELCTALRALDETDDKATMKKSAGTVSKLMHSKSITKLTLAEQPLASTRMMLQKCTLLSKYMGILDSKAFGSFQATLEEAHLWRKMAHVRLQEALVRKPFNETNVVELAAIAYARAVTIPTAGYIRPDAGPTQLKTMVETLNAVIGNPKKNARTSLQAAALTDVQRSVMEMVG